MHGSVSSVHLFSDIEAYLRSLAAQKSDRAVALLGQRCGDILFVHNATVIYPVGLQDSVKALKHLDDVLVAGLRIVGVCMTNSYTFRETMVDLHSFVREIDREFKSSNQSMFLPFVIGHLDKRTTRLSWQQIGQNLQPSAVETHVSKSEPRFAAVRAKYPIAAVFPLPVTSMEQDITDTLHRCVQRLMLTQDDEEPPRSVSTVPMSSTTAQHITTPTRNLLCIANYTLHDASIVAPVAAAYGGVGIWQWEVSNTGSYDSAAAAIDHAELMTLDSMPAPRSGVDMLGFSWADAKFMPRLNRPGAGFPVRYGEVIEGGSAAVDGSVHLYCLCGEQEPASRIITELERDTQRTLKDAIFWGLRETMAGGVETEVKLACRQWFLATTSARRDFPLLLGLAEPSTHLAEQQQQALYIHDLPTLSKLQREFDIRIAQEEQCVHNVLDTDAFPLKFRVVNESSEFVIRHPVAITPKHPGAVNSVFSLDDEQVSNVLKQMVTVKQGTEFGDQMEELRQKSQESRARIEQFAREHLQPAPEPEPKWCRFSDILDKADEEKFKTVAIATKLVAESKMPASAEGMHFSDLDELADIALQSSQVVVTRTEIVAEPNLFARDSAGGKAYDAATDPILQNIHQRKEKVMFWRNMPATDGRLVCAALALCIAVGVNLYSYVVNA